MAFRLFLSQGTGPVIFLCNILFHGIIKKHAFRPLIHRFLLHNPCNIGQKLWTDVVPSRKRAIP